MTAPWGSPQWQLLTADFLKNTGSTAADLAVTTLTVNSVAVPDANDGAALGTTSLQWSDLFLAEGGVINWDSSDVTITQTGDVLSFAGAATRYEFSANITPSANDGAALGTTALQFSDMFLAEGGVINFDNGDVTVTQTGNSLAVAGGNLIFPGTATNDDAAAGVVGEFISSTIASGSAVSLTTNTWANITSISLTAGDWDVQGAVAVHGTGTTSFDLIFASISTNSANGSSSPTASGITGYARSSLGVLNTNADEATTIGTTRFSLSATTTVYLEAYSSFTVSTATAYGYISARRVR